MWYFSQMMIAGIRIGLSKRRTRFLDEAEPTLFLVVPQMNSEGQLMEDF
ncbi:hypothetical protein OCEANICA350_12361 [Oceanicaulis sp. 350]|nr:hypothetical protein OCEANICA350_12361 [Oceanicaulis sp. 350]